ncbi:MAG TPA: hypothetical protein VJG13_15575 [Thermoanaerobaculia bacterium]|nr:hypothetical protein [Thermoanaerobaculia bacterium]
MRSSVRCATLLVLLAAPALAHPGVGIVMYRSGAVFYTDLEQVWRISPSGEKTVAVPDVHTHELWLDRDGTLYGEHLWYEGEESDRWGHRVWKRRPDGRIETVIPPTEGFLTGYSFVRDSAGTMYWADRRESGTVIRKRLADGRILTHSTGPFRDVRWMSATAGGTLHLTDGADLVRIGADGRRTVLARGLRQSSWTRPHVGEHHNLMGVWSGRSGEVYVAVYGGGVVKRVRRDGKVEIAARSPAFWGPTGGLTAPDGSLWLLESSLTNAVRVRRITPGGRETVF